LGAAFGAGNCFRNYESSNGDYDKVFFDGKPQRFLMKKSIDLTFDDVDRA
jgi:hypothetical protein